MGVSGARKGPATAGRYYGLVGRSGDAMAYLLDEAAAGLSELFGWLPGHRSSLPGFVDDSDAGRERAELGDLGGYVVDLTVTCGMRFTVAEDYLQAFAGLIRTESIYSIYPLARSTVDLMGRVYWLTEPGLNARRRAGRQLGDRLHSLDEQGRIEGGPAHLAEHARTRRAELCREAARHGVHRERPPGWTAASRDLWAPTAGEDPGLGAITYQLLSAFAHGTLYGITHFVSPVEDHDGKRLRHPTDGLLWARVETTAVQEAMAVAMCLVPYRAALARWAAWAGHDLTEAIVRLQDAARPFMEILREEESP